MDALNESGGDSRGQRIADRSGSPGDRAMKAGRIVKSNAQMFNTGTRAGGAWREAPFRSAGAFVST